MSSTKGSKVPATRQELTPQQKAARTRAEKQALEVADAQRLAQIVNLMIAGHSIETIAAGIGATTDEVERMLTADMGRYVRTQPALRMYVRKYISAKYTELLDAVWDDATDKTSKVKIENSVQAVRILREMDRLHGAAAPAQSEVKIESAPEAVEKLVQALSAQQGVGYDAGIFDIIDGEVVDDAVEETAAAVHDAEVEIDNEVDDGDDTL